MWVVSCCAFQFLFNIFTKQSQFISNEYQNKNSGCFFSIFSLFSRPGWIVCSFSYPFIVIFALVDVRAPRNVGGRFGFLVCFIVFVLVLVLVIVMLVVLNCTMKTCMQSLHFKLVPFVSYVFGCACISTCYEIAGLNDCVISTQTWLLQKESENEKKNAVESNAWYALTVCYTLNHFYGFLFASCDCP